MVVVLRFLYALLWYGVCVMSCIDTHHFVYKSLSQTLYPSIIGSVMCMLLVCFCTLKRTMLRFSIIDVTAVALIGYILFHGSFIADAEQYKQYGLISLLLIMIGMSEAVRENILDERHIENGILLISGIHVVYLIVQFAGFMNSGNPYFSLTGADENPNVTAIYIVLSIPFMTRCIKHDRLRVLSIILLLLSVVFVLALKCRTAYVGLVCMAISLLFTSKSIRAWLKAKCMSSTGAIAISAVTVLIVVIGYSAYTWKKDSADGRIFIWQRTSEMVIKNPMGVGYGMFEPKHNQYQADYFASHSDEYASSHLATACGSAYNDVLELSAEGGLTGGLVYILLVAFTLHHAIRNRNRVEIGVLAAIVAMSLSHSICYSITPRLLFVALMASVSARSRAMDSKYMSFAFSTFVFAACAFALHKNVPLTISQRQLKEYRDNGIRDIHALRNLYPSIGTSEAYWRYCADINRQIDDFIAADSCYTEARKYTYAPLVIYQSATCKEAIGDNDGAIKLMRTAVNMLPGNFSQKYHFMMMYDRMGEHHSAKLMAMEIMGMPFRKETKTVSIVRDAAHHILEE